MIAQSQSGTGKTAAFVLAMLSRVDPSKPYPQVINTFHHNALKTGMTHRAKGTTLNVVMKVCNFLSDFKATFSDKVNIS